jgi:hypothetical protein
MSSKDEGAAEKSSTDLGELLSALTLELNQKATSSKPTPLPPPNSKFEEELRSSSLTIFEPITDLGYFFWKPNDSLAYKTFTKVQSKKEILDQIQVNDSMPPTLVDLPSINRQLPKAFAHAHDQTYRNKYPYKMPHIVPLYVAKKHHEVNLDTVDFVFGGSALALLASKKNSVDHRFIGFVVPHTKVVLVAKEKEYIKNYADMGFQFERLVTGGSFTDRHDTTSTEHLHIVKVGGKFQILFCAEVDACCSSNGNPVEVTTGNPRYFGNKAFQMMSSGSVALCAGSKARGCLTGVRMVPLCSMIQEALLLQSKTSVECNILDGLKELKRAAEKFAPGEVFEITFQKEKIMLNKATGIDALPPASVVQDLLSKE